MNFLKCCYQSEEVRSGPFKVSKKTVCKWGWFYMKKIQALKKQTIVWPEYWNDGHPLLHDNDTPVFLISVDGVHCTTNEPIPFIQHFQRIPSITLINTNLSLTYELGISVYENKLVWIKGPKPASKHDISVYQEELKNKIPAGKRAIGDNGYHGEPNTISTPNSHDSSELHQFKIVAIELAMRHSMEESRISNVYQSNSIMESRSTTSVSKQYVLLSNIRWRMDLHCLMFKFYKYKYFFL